MASATTRTATATTTALEVTVSGQVDEATGMVCNWWIWTVSCSAKFCNASTWRI